MRSGEDSLGNGEMRGRRLAPIIAAIVIAVAALYILARPRAEHVEEGVYIGMKAPDFTVVGVDGSTFTLSKHRGEIVVIEFSTMWCPYCAKQIEAVGGVQGGGLHRLHRRRPLRGA